MREIKFRAWNQHLKKMDLNIHVLDTLNEYIARENHIVLQYTGLKDKNGVDIYCGDILKTTYYGTKKVQDTIMECAIMGLYSVDTSKIEVIGNIYQNPELLN